MGGGLKKLQPTSYRQESSTSCTVTKEVLLPTPRPASQAAKEAHKTKHGFPALHSGLLQLPLHLKTQICAGRGCQRPLP